MPKVCIGTSGWQYDHWFGPFYPDDVRRDSLLRFYSERLQSVEINGTFYSLPGKLTFEDWKKTVPDGFEFAVKASRYITHMKKLMDPEEPVKRLVDAARGLGKKLGPILFQLPPHWSANPDRLAEFVEALPSDCRYAFESRDESWFTDSVYGILRKKNAAFCMYDLAGRFSPKIVTADFVYVRLHGTSDAYQGEYGKESLAGWAGAISTWKRKRKDVYCYFNNDQKGYAVKDALRLQEMVMD